MALIGKTNAEKIWNFCKSKGMNDYGASVVLANMDAESGLNPKNLQDSYEKSLGFNDETYTALVDSGVYTKTQFVYDKAGYSLCQWTYWSRKKAMYEFVKAKGKSIGDLETVLEFFYKEISESYPSVLNVLKTATSIQQANNIMVSKYECPANITEAQKKRETIANTYYTRFVTNKGKESVINMGYKTCIKGKAVKLSAHFNSTEFDCHGNGCCSQTKINEQLVEYLQKIRDHFGKPITITSGYRCTIHNKNVGGATGSRHGKGDAADIVVSGVAPREVAKYAESIGILGIGLYETNSDGHFVHIDTRTTKAFWYGQAQKYRSTFGGASTTINSTTNSNTTTNNVVNTIGSSTIVLVKGDTGEAVKELQANLILLGYSCGNSGLDGVFGEATENAVKQFQKEYGGIGVDGISGYQTLTAIKKAIEVNAYRVQITASVLNVRSGASMNHTIVANVRKNSTYLVMETKNNWGRLNSPNGYISLRYAKKI